MDPIRYVPSSPETAPWRPAPVDELNLRPVLRGLWRRRVMIAACTLIAALASIVGTLLMSKSYTATATVFVTPIAFATDLTLPALSVEGYERLATSDLMQSRVVEALHQQKIIPESAAVKMTTQLYPSHDSRSSYLPIIGLAVQTTNPEGAQKAADLWASTFVEQARNLAAVGKTATVDFVLNEFPRASERVRDREREQRDVIEKQAGALAKERSRMAVDLKKAQVKERETLIVDLEDRLVETRVWVDESSHTVDRLAQELETIPQRIVLAKGMSDDAIWLSGRADKPPTPTSATDPRLQSQELNPVYVTTAEKLAEERGRLAGLRASQQRISDELTQAHAQADRLRDDALTSEVAVNNLERQQIIELGVYTRALDEAQARYKKLQDRIGDAQLAKAEQDAGVRVGSPAKRPSSPSGPNFGRNVTTGTAFGLIAALLGAWLLSYFDSSASREPAPPPQIVQRT